MLRQWIIASYFFIIDEKKEYILSKQLLRRGTNIGANVAEAEQTQSKPVLIEYAPVAELADALDFVSTTSVKELLISGFPVFIYEE